MVTPKNNLIAKFNIEWCNKSIYLVSKQLKTFCDSHLLQPERGLMRAARWAEYLEEHFVPHL